MRTEALAHPLTVWAGSARYTFSPGRDVTVGRDDRTDIPLEDPQVNQFTSRIHLVLRFDGTHWVAIDRSRNGIYVDGARVTTVNIRDGQTVVLGDPQQGPRLLFRVGAAADQAAGTPAARPDPTQSPVPSREPAGRSWRKPPARRQTVQQKFPPLPQPPADPASAPPSDQPTEPVRMPPRQQASRSTEAEQQVGAPRSRRPEPPSQLPTDPIPVVKPAPRKEAPPAAKRPTRPPQPPPPSIERSAPAVEHGPQPDDAQVDKPERQADAVVPARAHKAATRGLQAHRLNVVVDGRQVLTDLSFTASPGTLTAVIGPAACSKTALINTLGGLLQPSQGEAVLDGRDVSAMRSRIGVVPREDVVHRQLTVEQAVGYAAELRLPTGTSADDCRRSVHEVLTELGLQAQRTIQIGSLTDDARKRASMAAELVAGPSLLLLDEPTAGLEAEQERQTIAALRRLADAGRVVVVTTTSPARLDQFDRVLVLTAGGTMAFAGPPAQVETALGSSDWSEIFERISSGRQPVVAREEVSRPAHRPAAPPEQPEPRLGLLRQIAVATRRQAWVIVGDQRYFLFLTILPIFFSALALILPGHTGLGVGDPYGDSPDEALQLLVVLTMGAVVMGTALTIRDLVGERGVFRRERSLWLSPWAYLVAKLLVYSVIAVIQTGIVTTATVVGKGAPTGSALLLGDPTIELYISVAATAIVSAIVALALASVARYQEQLMPMAVLLILFALVFCGGTLPLTPTFSFDVISWLIPARWGLAAAASSIDLDRIDLLASHDALWAHTTGRWLLDLAILSVFAVAGIALLRWRLGQTAPDWLHRKQQKLGDLFGRKVVVADEHH